MEKKEQGFHIPKGEDIYTFFSELLPSQCPGKVAEPLEETTAQDTYKCWIPKLWYTETSELQDSKGNLGI